MKYIILITLFFCSLALYGQDLIVTASGDSLKCKITEVSAVEIQFRFGQGRVISINRSEVESFQYNFNTVGKGKSSKKTSSTDKYKPVTKHKDYLPFYAGLSGGIRNFGSVSIGEMKSKAPIFFGLDIAGFFNPNIGAGIKFNMENSKVDFGEIGSWNDRIMFVGAGLYGRWTKNKLELNASASVGAIMWNMSNLNLNNTLQPDESTSSLGGYLSTGFNYMVSKNIGIGLNLQSAIGKVENKKSIERNPAGVGAGVNFGYYF